MFKLSEIFQDWNFIAISERDLENLKLQLKFNFSRGLSYYSRPNYAYLFDVLTSIMQDGDYHYSDDFEWERESLEDDKRCRPK